MWRFPRPARFLELVGLVLLSWLGFAAAARAQIDCAACAHITPPSPVAFATPSSREGPQVTCRYSCEARDYGPAIEEPAIVRFEPSSHMSQRCHGGQNERCVESAREFGAFRRAIETAVAATLPAGVGDRVVVTGIDGARCCAHSLAECAAEMVTLFFNITATRRPHYDRVIYEECFDETPGAIISHAAGRRISCGGGITSSKVTSFWHVNTSCSVRSIPVDCVANGCADCCCGNGLSEPELGEECDRPTPCEVVETMGETPDLVCDESCRCLEIPGMDGGFVTTGGDTGTVVSGSPVQCCTGANGKLREAVACNPGESPRGSGRCGEVCCAGVHTPADVILYSLCGALKRTVPFPGNLLVAAYEPEECDPVCCRFRDGRALMVQGFECRIDDRMVVEMSACSPPASSSCGETMDPADDFMITGSGAAVGTPTVVDLRSATIGRSGDTDEFEMAFEAAPTDHAPTGATIQYTVVLSQSESGPPGLSDPELRLLVTPTGPGPLKLFFESGGSDHVVIDGGASFEGMSVVLRIPTTMLTDLGTFVRALFSGLIESPDRFIFDTAEAPYVCGG